MKRAALVIVLILLAAPAWADNDPVIFPNPPVPIVPPVPPPLPAPPTVLNKGQLYVVSRNSPFLLVCDKPSLARVVPFPTPGTLMGDFVDPQPDDELKGRTFAKGSTVYVVKAIGTGTIVLIASTDLTGNNVSRRRVQVNSGPPPPPVITYTIAASDGGAVVFTPNTSLVAAKAASDVYAKAHPGVMVTVKDSAGTVVYTAFVDPTPPVDPFQAILQAAYFSDTDADKATSVATLKSLYQAAAALAPGTFFQTSQGVMKWIKDSEAAAKPPLLDAAIPHVRDAIEAELNKTISPTTNANPLDQPTKDLIAAQFNRMAVALGNLKAGH